MKNTVFKSPHEALKAVYGYDDFRPGQLDIINATLKGQDVLGVMTTGGGKSVCYQIPALCLPGTTIVISPLIALMKDQVERLSSCGISAAYLNSSLSLDESVEIINNLRSGKYRLFYVAPERLYSNDFIEILCNVDIPLFAVDESHCISSWGNDFRLAYRRIPDVIIQIELYKGTRIPRFACTATATPDVRRDIISNLQMNNPYVQVGSFDRPNIEFSVRESNSKTNDAIDIVRQSPNDNIIIYCATIKSVESLYSDLRRSGINVGMYHGKMDSEAKNSIQEQFLRNEIRVMVATKAFGMGVDKSNINLVLHYHMPSNLEDYYQEAGRAGRDGAPAKAILLFNKKDRDLQNFFIDASYPDPSIIKGVQYALRAFYDGMPITLSYDEIANFAPDNIKIHQVESILRILDDQGFLRLHNFEKSNASPTIEILNPDLELNLENFTSTKKVVLNNLNRMERFSRTYLCRREFILNHFGEPISHKNCGNCDVCKHNTHERGRLNSVIPSESIRSCLELIQLLNDQKKRNDIVDLLLGIKSRFFESAGLDKVPQYGSLKSWTKSEVNKLINHLIDKEVIYECKRTRDTILLTTKGMDLLNSSRPIMEVATSGFESVKRNNNSNGVDSTGIIPHKVSETFDHILASKLAKLRSNISVHHNIPAFMVFSDSMMRNFATIKPESKDDLAGMGYSRANIEKYGPYILRVIKEYGEINNSIESNEAAL